jgi:hypothetical protein
MSETIAYWKFTCYCLLTTLFFTIGAFIWAVGKWRKTRNTLHQKPDSIIELCVGCGEYKYPKFRGIWNECICSKECKGMYEDYLIEISEFDHQNQERCH